MMPTTMNTRAMMARITARIVRPDDLSTDPLVELTIPPLRARGWTASRGSSADEENLPPAGAPGAEEVTDDILTETFGCRLQHAPAVPPRYIVNERAEPRVVSQHENIQRGVPAGHLVHFGQRELDGLGGWRPVEPGAPVALQVSRGLAVGHDEDDRVVLWVPVDMAPG